MGFWRPSQYEDYVKAHAGTESHELLHPDSEDSKYPSIFILYDSMPKWMGISNLLTLDIAGKGFRAQNEAHYRLVRQAYRNDKDRYIDDVTSRLSQIEQRLTGVALLTEANATNYDVTITPSWKHGKPAAARTKPRIPENATARGALIDYSDRSSIDPADNRGTGRGSDTTIFFTPSLYTVEFMRDAKAADESLFHELVHACREMRGVEDDIPVNADYVDQEEYLAVVLTNIYLSEKGQIKFVASHDHGPDDVLKGPDADWFLRNVQKVNMSPRQLMENFKSSQPAFYYALAHLPPDRPKFNPVRWYFEETKGNFKM